MTIVQGSDVETALNLLADLSGKTPGREVPLLNYVRRMVELGFTSGSAIRVVDELIDDDRVLLTNRYNLRLSS